MPKFTNYIEQIQAILQQDKTPPDPKTVLSRLCQQYVADNANKKGVNVLLAQQFIESQNSGTAIQPNTVVSLTTPYLSTTTIKNPFRAFLESKLVVDEKVSVNDSFIQLLRAFFAVYPHCITMLPENIMVKFGLKPYSPQLNLDEMVYHIHLETNDWIKFINDWIKFVPELKVALISTTSMQEILGALRHLIETAEKDDTLMFSLIDSLDKKRGFLKILDIVRIINSQEQNKILLTIIKKLLPLIVTTNDWDLLLLSDFIIINDQLFLEHMCGVIIQQQLNNVNIIEAIFLMGKLLNKNHQNKKLQNVALIFLNRWLENAASQEEKSEQPFKILYTIIQLLRSQPNNQQLKEKFLPLILAAIKNNTDPDNNAELLDIAIVELLPEIILDSKLKQKFLDILLLNDNLLEIIQDRNILNEWIKIEPNHPLFKNILLPFIEKEIKNPTSDYEWPRIGVLLGNWLKAAPEDLILRDKAIAIVEKQLQVFTSQEKFPNAEQDQLAAKAKNSKKSICYIIEKWNITAAIPLELQQKFLHLLKPLLYDADSNIREAACAALAQFNLDPFDRMQVFTILFELIRNQNDGNDRCKISLIKLLENAGSDERSYWLHGVFPREIRSASSDPVNTNLIATLLLCKSILCQELYDLPQKLQAVDTKFNVPDITNLVGNYILKR